MTLTEKEREKIEKNIGLVHTVIRDKLQPPYQVGMYSYEDLFQIGCIGLCKAASTDKGGTFSTYAYRLIWHQICDAMIYAVHCCKTGKPRGAVGFPHGYQTGTRTGKG